MKNELLCTELLGVSSIRENNVKKNPNHVLGKSDSSTPGIRCISHDSPCILLILIRFFGLVFYKNQTDL